MINRQRSKLNMYVLVKEFLLASIIITDRWTVFAALFATFKDNITEIFALSAKHDEDKKGVTTAKNNLKEKLIDAILLISEKCQAYALITENFEFLSLIKHVKTDLLKLTDTDLINTASSLHTHVLENLKDMADYDLQQSDLDKLLKWKDDYLAIYTKPTGDRKSDARLTERMNVLFSDSDKLLVKMDAVVVTGRHKEPDFYEEYFRKRVIIHLGGRSRSLQFWVLSDEDGLPIHKAKVVIWLKNGTNVQKMVKSTGPKGGIWEKNMVEGEYAYEVTYHGRVKQNGVLFINAGIMTDVTVRLVKS